MGPFVRAKGSQERGQEAINQDEVGDEVTLEGQEDS